MTFETARTPGGAGLVSRVQNILLRPQVEWAVIDGEAASVGRLFTAYAVPLAAIGPVCAAIGAIVFGYGLFGVTYRPSPVGVIANAVVSYGLALASVFVMGLIIEALAPNFGGVKDRVQAMKVAVYGSTASWIAGALAIVPMLGPLALLAGLYSLYLIYLGLPRVMKTPQDKALSYTAVVVLVAIVLAIVVGLMLAPLRLMGAGLGAVGAPAAAGQVSLGGATVDVARLQAASAQMQAQSAALQAQAAAAGAAAASGGAGSAVTVATVSPDALKAVMPAQIAGFTRTELTSASAGVAGMNTASAEGRYEKGEAHMQLTVASMGAMGGMAALAGAIGVNSTKDTATGYEKITSANGRTLSESYDRAAHTGKVSVMAGGFVVDAEGANVSVEDLRAAVAAVTPERLAALPKS